LLHRLLHRLCSLERTDLPVVSYFSTQYNIRVGKQSNTVTRASLSVSSDPRARLPPPSVKLSSTTTHSRP